VLPLLSFPTISAKGTYPHCTATLPYLRLSPRNPGLHISVAVVARFCLLVLLREQSQFRRTDRALALKFAHLETNTTNNTPASLIGCLLALCNPVPLFRNFASPLLGCPRLQRYVHFPGADYSNPQTDLVTATLQPHLESSSGLQRCLILNGH
jgi:hypothetical protein